ncbi:hypothetical protein AB1Y20_003357 [Prymnesium parvum]|uniref:ACT domain-containing protein n=1 Tax=Prymnesium parvum TaxID=97485 RepID=A0AB34JAN3_PRYPA
MMMLLLAAGALSWSPATRPMVNRAAPFQARAHRASPRLAAVSDKVEVLPPVLPTKVPQWEVHKFGGASLATAELYIQCSELLRAESASAVKDGGKHIPTMAIVSAKGGVTDKLIAVVNAARKDIDESARLLQIVADEQVEVARQIANEEIAATVEEMIRADTKDILMVIRSVSLIKTIPPTTMELVTGYGEIWSAMTMFAYLKTAGVPTVWLDARKVLVVEDQGAAGLGEKGSSNVVGVEPLWEPTSQLVNDWWNSLTELQELDYSKAAPIVVVTGFVAATVEGTPTTLKRSGSDYSATIFAKLMGASRITMWKNVDGVYTADPRRVPEAFPIESLKYDEAIELAYFGAQVLHPSAMMPCIEGNIPIYVRNVFNPSHPGTVITGRACSMSEGAQTWAGQVAEAATKNRKAACTVKLKPNESPIRGITSIDNVAIVNLEGTGIATLPDVNYRLFGALFQANVQVIMVTQASSDSSVCLVVPAGDANRALRALNAVFERELARSQIASITLEHGLSIVAIVGEGMAFRPGVGATFAKAMANSRVNMRAIAQGSSERQISIVVEQSDCTRALRAAHAALALSNSRLSVALVGATGQVGTALVQQLIESGRVLATAVPGKVQKGLTDLGLDFKVTCVARSSGMAFNYDGLDITSIHELLAPGSPDLKEPDLNELSRFLNEDYNGNRVVIDCSASQEVADQYPTWFSSGVHVITANKKAGSGPSDLYQRCREAGELGKGAQWYYETTGPGSGLPVINTLKDMVQSGDDIRRVEGIFSGTVSYLINSVSTGTPLSQALKMANELGMCEPDPRDDLTGLDVKRKLVVLGRELGLSLEIEDVKSDSLLPPELADWEPDTSSDAPSLIDQLSAAMEPYDSIMTELVEGAKAKGMILTPVSRVDMQDRSVSFLLTSLPPTDRLTRAVHNDNIIAITSARYSPQPLIIQGPGAGAQITASGLFADLLHLSRTLVEWTIPRIQ